jgi:hypothetical protein
MFGSTSLRSVVRGVGGCGVPAPEVWLWAKVAMVLADEFAEDAEVAVATLDSFEIVAVEFFYGVGFVVGDADSVVDHVFCQLFAVD